MIRYKLILLSFLALALLILSGCATKPSVFSDFDASHDFTKDKTFTWVQDPPMLKSGDYLVSPIAEARMTAAIKKEFEDKGYQFVSDDQNADFSVTYTMGARDHIEIVEYYNRYYVDWRWGQYYFPYFLHFPFNNHHRRYRDFLPRTYTDGAIAIDVFDARSQQPIWHAKASKRLSAKDLDSDLNSATDIAVKLLYDFPWKGCKPIVTVQCRPF